MSGSQITIMTASQLRQTQNAQISNEALVADTVSSFWLAGAKEVMLGAERAGATALPILSGTPVSALILPFDLAASFAIGGSEAGATQNPIETFFTAGGGAFGAQFGEGLVLTFGEEALGAATIAGVSGIALPLAVAIGAALGCIFLNKVGGLIFEKLNEDGTMDDVQENLGAALTKASNIIKQAVSNLAAAIDAETSSTIPQTLSVFSVFTNTLRDNLADLANTTLNTVVSNAPGTVNQSITSDFTKIGTFLNDATSSALSLPTPNATNVSAAFNAYANSNIDSLSPSLADALDQVSASVTGTATTSDDGTVITPGANGSLSISSPAPGVSPQVASTTDTFNAEGEAIANDTEYTNGTSEITTVNQTTGITTATDYSGAEGLGSITARILLDQNAIASNAPLGILIIDGFSNPITETISTYDVNGSLTNLDKETAVTSQLTTYNTITHVDTVTDYSQPAELGTATLASSQYQLQTGDTYNSIAAGLGFTGVTGAILALMNHAGGGDVAPAGSQIYVPTGTGTAQSFVTGPVSVSGPAIVNLDTGTVTPLSVGGTDSTNAIYVIDNAGDLIDLIDDTGNANPIQFYAGIEQSEPVTGSNGSDTFPARAYVAISGDNISRLYIANASGTFSPPQALQTSNGVFSLEDAPALLYFALNGGTTTTSVDPITGNPSGPYANVSPTASLASFNSASDAPDGAWNIGVDSQGNAVITGDIGSGYSGTATLTQGQGEVGVGIAINSGNSESYEITQPDITSVLLDQTYYALETLPTGGTTNDNYGYDTADTFGGIIVAEGSGTNTFNFNSLAPVTYWHVNGTSDTANLNAATTEIYMPGKESDYTASYDNSQALTLTDSVNGTSMTTFNIGLGNGEINFADGNVIGLGDMGDPIEYAGGGANYGFALDGGNQTIYGNGSNGGAGSFANFTTGDAAPDDAWNITEDTQGRVIFDGTYAGYDGVATLSNIQDVILNGTKYDLVAVPAGGVTTGMSSTISTPTDGTADTIVAEAFGVTSTLTFASTGITYWHANGFNDTANLQAGQTQIYLRDAQSDYTISYDGNGSLTLTDTVPDSNGTMTVNFAGGSGELVFADGQTISLDAIQAGPSITAQAPVTVESGQTTVIGTVTPSIVGDTLTLTETAGTGTLSLGTVQADGTQQVIYTAPASIPASATDAVSYTVSENGVNATGTASVQLDAGPTIAAQTPTTVGSGQTTVIGTVTPGIAGDALTLTETAGIGILSLGTVQADGTQQVIYTAPASVPANTMDAVSYMVSENGASATGTASVQLNAAAQPQTITLAAGSSTSVQSGQDTGDSFIFAGTTLNNAPGLQFIGPGNNTVGTLMVIPKGFGGMSQSSNVEATGGIQLNGSTFHDFLEGAGTLTLDGSSTINNGGSLQLLSFGDVVNLNGTITLGAFGNNNLTVAGLSPSASTTVVGGTIIQYGETDVTSVKFDRGTDFQIDGGILELFGGPGSFQGTIGPSSSAPGASALGIFGVVEIYNEISVAGATFDTTTGMLSLLSSKGTVVDNIHFAGDASGLTLTTQPNSSAIDINDRVSSARNLPGDIPLTFHT